MMKRSIGFGSYDAYPKTIIAQNDVYNKMSHHYRRLYSAKPCIDTGLRKQRSSSKDRKISIEWNTCRNRNNNSSQTKLKYCPNQRDSAQHLCSRVDSRHKDVLDHVEYVPFHPRILKSDVESKVRSLSVYHPPRKKSQPVAVEICNKSEKQETGQRNSKGDDYEWTRENTSNASKLSSSDSAYTEEGDGMWSGGESRGETPQSPNSCWSMDVRSADGPYISFLRAITDEVLRKGIFTNKALKKLFREHIEKNIHRLDLKRMENEVEKLQKELGIPKEDNLNETDFGLGSVNPEWYNSLKETDSASRDNLGVAESLEKLVLASEKESTDDRDDESPSGLKKNQSSENSRKQSTDSNKVSSKKSLKDIDNDSSIGCEISSDYSGSGDGEGEGEGEDKSI